MNAKTAADVAASLAKYEALTIAWDQASQTPAKANRLFVQAHRIAVSLRASPAGRSGLQALLSHESRAVRLCSASECLPFSPDAASLVLRKIALGPGLHAVSAETVLKEFEAGRLNMDW